MDFELIPATRVPLIRMDASPDAPNQKTRNDVLRSLSEFGFLLIDQSEIGRIEIDRAFECAANFFSLDAAEKMRVSSDAATQRLYGNVGYYRFKQERAVGAGHADLKEFFHIGRDISTESRLKAVYGDNCWPSEPATFRREFSGLYEKFSALADRVMTIVATAAGLDVSGLQNLVLNGNSILRVLHYPPVQDGDSAVAMRGAPHTGINLLGLQPRSTHNGLQFFTPDQRWVALDRIEDSWMTVNIGEMLQFISGDRLIATRHRVANSESANEDSVDRYTIVYFYHPDPTKSLVQQTTQKHVGAGDWLLGRLKDIGMMQAQGSSERSGE